MRHPFKFFTSPSPTSRHNDITAFLLFLLLFGIGYHLELPLQKLVTGEYRASSCSGLDTIPTWSFAKARYDNKRLVRISDFYFTGDNWESLVNSYGVCFATQTTIERIYWLPYVLEKWTGPLSLSVYLTCEEEWLVFNLFRNYLSSCHKEAFSQITMHLAVPANVTRDLKVDSTIASQWNNIDYEEIQRKQESCPNAKKYLYYLLAKFPTINREKLKFKEVYPQNHMRNLARKACGVKWTYLADIDIIPRWGMAGMLQEFFESQKNISCKKCAYVIPSFELSEKYAFPEAKRDLVKLFKTGAARQFHAVKYAPAQAATNYSRWVSTFVEEGPVKISHEISNETSKYEPFYISSEDIPPFDERFLGYGYTRSSQWRAAQMAGWNFFVLTPVFSIHWGLQSDATVFSPKKDGVGMYVRKEQIKKNKQYFEKVTKELELKKELGLFK